MVCEPLTIFQGHLLTYLILRDQSLAPFGADPHDGKGLINGGCAMR
jgi:hypothetical protein